MTDKQLLKRLEDALKSERLDIVPKGFFRREQWQVKFGCKKTKTVELIKAGIKSGTLERKDFRVKKGNQIAPTPHYRAK